MSTSASGLFAVALLSFTPACMEDGWRDDYQFAHHGEHVTVYGYERAAAGVFGGSYDGLDRQIRTSAMVLAIEEPVHLDYRWMSFDFMQDRCPQGTRACIVDGDIFAQALPDMKVVARFTARHRPEGRCASFLEQGIGEYLSGPSLRHVMPSNRDVRALMIESRMLEVEDSARAGHFVSFLVETYGTHAIAGLCDTVGTGDSLDEWDAGFQQTLGLELDAVLIVYEAYPICSVQQYRARIGECEGEPDFVFSEKNQSFEFMISLLDSRAMNATPGVAGDGYIRRLIYVPDAAVLVPISDVMSQQCVPCSMSPLVHNTETAAADILDYPHGSGGLHEFIWFFHSDSLEAVPRRIGSWW